MSVETRGLPLRAAAPAPHVRLRSRIYGLGSVFGKTLRDARLAMVVVGALLVVMVVAGGVTMSQTYGTLEARVELGALSGEMPPAMRGLYGDPVNVDTLGGFISWHYGAYFAMLAGLWSILALSSTLAAEARRGCLDFLVATPHSRLLLAAEKVAGHVAALAIVMAAVAIAAWATGAAFATMPGDEIGPSMAVSFAVGLGLKALVAGSVAFALSTLLGRGAAAGIAGALMLGGYVVNGYRAVVPAFDSIAGLGWFSWTAGHIPLAGRSDWGGLAFTAVVAIVLLALGAAIFARRDVGVTVSLPVPGLPRALLGVRGPFGRSFGDLVPSTFWWGVGLACYGVLMAAASGALLDILKTSPGLTEIFREIIPGIDITTAAGFLQIAFADFGFILIGLAAATFVAGRASDETSGRLELQLATTLTRARWALASGLASWSAVVLVTILLGVAIAVGVASVGQDPVTPAVGVLVLALYGIALAGLGVAAGGLFGASVSVPVVLAVTVGTFLLDTLAPILRLPDWVAQLALTSHLGQPMVGNWDVAGVVACLVLALGGLALGAWGMGRRDVAG